MTTIVPRAYLAEFGGEQGLADAVADFAAALEAHALTVDVPAPTAHPLVADLVRRFGGHYEIEPEPEAAPEPPFTAAVARAALIRLIEGATQPILNAYPAAERLSWDAKEAEAKAFMEAAEPVLWHYAMLRDEVASELAIDAGDVTAQQLAGKAEAVLWMAAQWRALISALSGIRKRVETDIYSATDDAARRAVVEAARAAISAVAP